MKDLIFKRITILNLSLLLMATVPKISFAQIIYGLDKASHFNTSHHGPFSVYAGTFRIKSSANQLSNNISARTHFPVRVITTGQLHSVVIGPLPSPETVRTLGQSLADSHALKPHPVNGVANVPHGRSTAQSASLLPINSLASGMRVTLLAGGNSYASDNRQHVFFPVDTFRTDSFESDGNKINFGSAIGISYEKTMDTSKGKPWGIFQSISLGVNAYYNKGSQNGSVYEYGLPDFNNSTYNMKIRSYRVMLDAELVLHPLYFGVMPFVEAGVGGAQNTLDFQNIPRPNIGADGGYYHLSNNTNTDFAYEVGAGLKMFVSDRFLISARYLFADCGKAISGVSDNNTGVLLAYPISAHVHSQSVLFGLSYLFG